MTSFLRQFDRYISAVKWLAGRVWRHFKNDLVLVLLGQWLGLAISSVSVMSLLFLVRKIESAQPLQIMGVGLPLAEGRFLAGAVAVILLAMTAGILLLYQARKGAVVLSARFNHSCAAEVANGFGVFGASSVAYTGDARLRNEIARLMGGDARNAGMALRRMIDAKLATLVLLAGGALLFYLHWAATLVVLLVALSILPFYYRINQKAARATRRLEAMSSPGRMDCLRVLEQHKRVNSWQATQLPFDGNGYPAFQAVVESYRDRFVAMTQSELTSRLLMAFAVCILAVGLGYYLQEGEIPWLLVLSYLLVLRFVMLAIRQINQAFTSISRFYPSLFRLSQYFSALDASPQSVDLERLGLFGRRKTLLKRYKKITLKLGRSVFLYLPVEISRFSMELPARALGLKTAAQQRSFFEMTALVAGGASVADSLSESADIKLLAEVAGLSLEQLNSALGMEKMGCSGEEAVWLGKCRARTLLAKALLSEKPLIVINLDIPDISRAFIAMHERFAERRVLLCSHRIGCLQPGLGISAAAVVGYDGGLLALGSGAWMQENWKVISASRRRFEKRLLEKKAVKGHEDLFEEE